MGVVTLRGKGSVTAQCRGRWVWLGKGDWWWMMLCVVKGLLLRWSVGYVMMFHSAATCPSNAAQQKIIGRGSASPRGCTRTPDETACSRGI